MRKIYSMLILILGGILLACMYYHPKLIELNNKVDFYNGYFESTVSSYQNVNNYHTDKITNDSIWNFAIKHSNNNYELAELSVNVLSKEELSIFKDYLDAIKAILLKDKSNMNRTID